MTEVVWRDPPAQRRGPDVTNGGKYAGFAAELRSNPGRWAVMGVFHPSYAALIRKGSIAAFRPVGDFEVTVRRRPGDRECDLYVRYVGKVE